MSTPGNEPLYPLCDEFWPLPDYILSELESNGVYRETARIFFRGADRKTKKRVKQKQKKLDESIADRLPKNAEIKNAKEMTLRYRGRSQEILKTSDNRWSDSIDQPYFCVSYRDRSLNTWGNWDLDKWYNLIDQTIDVTGIEDWVVLGTPEEIEKFGGESTELKDNLNRSIDLLNHCEFSITPESGSGFLSTMCGAITYTFGHENHRNRYKRKWNHTGTKLYYIGSRNRKFSPTDISERISETYERRY